MHYKPCDPEEEYPTCKLFAAFLIEETSKSKYPGITTYSSIRPDGKTPEIHVILDQPMENIRKITEWNFG